MSGMCVFILTRRGAQIAPAFLKKIANKRQILVTVLEGLVTFLEYSRHGMCYLLSSLLCINTKSASQSA